MGICADCGGKSHTIYGEFGNEYLCSDCYNKRRQNKLIAKSEEIQECSDFQTWDHGDLSELFWIHLGRYVKEPNPESLSYMEMAYRWACHASHGLTNSFSNALKWACIDLHTESAKWETR